MAWDFISLATEPITKVSRDRKFGLPVRDAVYNIHSYSFLGFLSQANTKMIRNMASVGITIRTEIYMKEISPITNEKAKANSLIAMVVPMMDIGKMIAKPDLL